jgi:hypothetical protein
MPVQKEKDDSQDIRPEDSKSSSLEEDQEADGQYRRLVDVGHMGASRKSLDLGEDQEADGQYRRLVDVSHMGASRKSLDLGEDQEADGQYRRLVDVGHTGASRKSLDLGEDQEVSRESLDSEIHPVLALVTSTQERNEAYFRKLLDTQRSIEGAIGDIYREGIQAEGETLLRIWLEIERSRS